ncbi:MULTISPECIES: hypothetical protein [unclassified Paraburkholderia]|uniref:hypothetical protein n=1 Tax=unclassified Paraburkholderia TaxID=2615204 RepID=UPI002AB65ACC|nr:MULTISPECIES: hypothetical protein [unclassified Paraburkholderia]
MKLLFGFVDAGSVVERRAGGLLHVNPCMASADAHEVAGREQDQDSDKQHDAARIKRLLPAQPTTGY